MAFLGEGANGPWRLRDGRSVEQREAVACEARRTATVVVVSGGLGSFFLFFVWGGVWGCCVYFVLGGLSLVSDEVLFESLFEVVFWSFWFFVLTVFALTNIFLQGFHGFAQELVSRIARVCVGFA